MRLVSIIIFFSTCLIAAPKAWSAPWVKTDDQFLQQSIQQLANAGIIKTPVNTWPLMWQPILQDLSTVDTTQLTNAQLHAYFRIKSAAAFAENTHIKSLSLQASSDPLGQQSFGSQYQQKYSASAGIEIKSNNWSAGLYGRYRNDSYDANSISENETNWDNSYGAYTAGNWVLIAAVQPQWWGPAIHSSFNFNNQQRAARSIQISRLNPNTSLHDKLDWLGPVSFNMQYGRFAGTAPLRHATYYAARIGLKPFSNIELGFSGRNIQLKTDELLLGESYSDLLPKDNLSTVGADVRFHLSQVSAIYGEISIQNDNHTNEGATGYLVGGHYHLGNQHVLLRFFSEYQHIAQDYNQWLYIQPSKQAGIIESEWVAGVQISMPDGNAGYMKFSQRKYSDHYNYTPQDFTKSTNVFLGYQSALFKGLLQLDYQVERGEPLSGDAEFEHAVGVKWEWRW